MSNLRLIFDNRPNKSCSQNSNIKKNAECETENLFSINNWNKKLKGGKKCYLNG